MKSKDSTTFVLQIKPERKVTSYRLDKLISKRFKDKCRIQGLSTCHVIESLMYAYSMTMPDEPRIQQPPVTINLKVERIVSKARRKGKWSFVEDVEKIEMGDLDSCYRCGSHLVTYALGHYETPIRYVTEYVCTDCYWAEKRIYGRLGLHWKKLRP